MKVDLHFAFRDNEDATRSYVVVNPLLAKHIPAAPGTSLDYFKKLGDMVADACQNEKVLVIGFAETATAVGAAVASVIKNAVYVHTTREAFPARRPVAVFMEEHSHAKNQALFLDEGFADLSKYDRLVFVEDEITTGKTILNFLTKINFSGKITISALVFNGFNDKDYFGYDADFYCLQRIGYVEELYLDVFPNPRMGVRADEYIMACGALTEWFIKSVGLSAIKEKRVLVVGTEEFMYPALTLGEKLEKYARSLMSHSTTRSPLSPGDNPGYPINSRVVFPSVYDANRTSYFYNIKQYDTVIIVTDATGGAEGLIDSIRATKCEKIYLVRVNNAN